MGLKNSFSKHWLKIALAILGAVAGYLYYSYIGCLSGSCPLTSNPWSMIVYGAIMGYLLSDIFKRKQIREKNKTDKFKEI